MIISLDDYSELMGSPVTAIAGITVEGDTSCGPLSCGQRSRLISDLEWAESMIESELGRYGISLYYKGAQILTDQPYAIKETSDMVGVLRTVETVVVTSITNGIVTLDFLLDTDDFDEACDTILSYAVKTPVEGGFATRWITQDRDGLLVSLTAKDANVSVVDCDTGEVSYAESVTIITTILKPTGPRMTRSSSGCSVDDESECGRCGGECYVDGCYRQSGASTLLMDFSAQPCVCGGRLSYYTADIVKAPVERKRHILDAIVSLANSRGTLNDCGDCSSALRERVARDNGVLSTTTKDMRETVPYLFVNPFGVFTPGAVTAWRTVERLTAGRGGAGVL